MGGRPRITMARRFSAGVSGKWSAGWLVLCFTVAAVLVPVAAHLPRWAEVELVLAAWWFIWAVAIAVLLHRGGEVEDDLEPRSPRIPDPAYFSGSGGCSPISLDLEGCAIVLLLLAVVLVFGAAVWLLVQILIPGLAFLLYLVVRGMIARAVNGQPKCHGNRLRSACWGVLWATLYTAPIALLVYAAHYIMPKLQGS